MEFSHLISRASLSLSTDPAETNPDLHPEEIPENGEHYACVVRGHSHEMTFHFTVAAGDGPPAIEDALRYLGAVAVEYESYDDIIEWADDFDLDPGHVDTRDAFEAMGRITRDLWRLVGSDAYDELCKEIEIEQAVDMAWAGYIRSRGG